MRKNTTKTSGFSRKWASTALTISLALSCSLSVNPALSQTSADAAGDEPATGNGGYPRVTSLEQEFLGKTYVADPLATRVARLETNKFGKPQPGDIADRLDKLDQFAAPTKVPAGYQSADDETSSQQPMANSDGKAGGGADSTLEAAKESGDIGNYPRITELEQEFLGKVYKGEVVQNRLARLEDKEFSKEYPDDALCDRVDRLDKKSTNKPKVAQDDEGGGGQPGGKSSPVSGLGRTLVNMLGGGMGSGMIGGGGLGMMGPGMLGGWPPGMGPGASRRAAQQANNDPVPKAPAAPTNPFGPAGEDVKGAENRTGTMEKFCFGKESSSKSLEERVAKLEKRLVPWEHNAASKDMNTRVNHLWSMLQAANSTSHKDVTQ